MAQRETAELASLRRAKLTLLQDAYPTFLPFLIDGMLFLGFSTTEIQKDIGDYIANGPQYLMVQAQRGEAKTTITALFCVWCLIHNPKFRILIVSAGAKQAKEISTLIVQVIGLMPELECLRPDRAAGDRTSVEAYDVHYSLKGPDKSPSVRCEGATANLQGARADLLLADDVESQKNSKTAVQREVILQVMRDFASICSTGRILYLGTPQSQDSVYNTLPGSGFDLRIWPGRYPNAEQMKHYGEHLAPLLAKRLRLYPQLGEGGGLLGDQGRPTDPQLPAGTEEFLQKKEAIQGTAFFQLQHMLNTTLTDAGRYPLKLDKLVVMRIAQGRPLPLEVYRTMDSTELRKFRVGQLAIALSPARTSEEFATLQGIVMYVDPAGGGENADETAYAVTGFLNGNVYLLDVGGIPGGFEETNLTILAEVAARWKPQRVIIEKNFGYGAFRQVWLPILVKHHKCAVEDDYVTGQKELRIIGTLEPVLGRGALIINEDIIESEEASLARYAPSLRNSYCFFHQMAKITRDRKSLLHDDRLDAVEGAVRYWVEQLQLDQQDTIQRQRAQEMEEWVKNPLRYNTGRPPVQGNLLNNRLKGKR